ncbi:hypothetical protein [Peribacillus asahii]|uniref:hypothetical protein n=1 Tax=Peribacillus asahii TaxID=228899 RepID=UPI0020796BC5|nr:hypothetical protein [Peribacillus asahii]USK70054.1 hypothetical protein LIS76_21600 [Peribacillus asahii]
MKKKKAIKIVTVTASAASVVVAVPAVQPEAATNSVDRAIIKATTQVNKAFNLYYNTAKKNNKLPSGSAIRKEVKLAEEYYAAAQKEIAKNGGSKTKKTTYTKKLEASKTSLNRAKNYVAAVSVTLKASRTALETAIESGKQGKVYSAHIALEKKITEFEKAVKKTFGPDARRLLTKTYTTPAKAEAAAVDTEVKVYAAYKEIESKKLIATDLKKAGELIESVKAEVGELQTKDTTVAINLLKAVEKNNKAYEAALPPVVEAISTDNVTTLTITGAGLNNLKAEDITVEGNKVATYNATSSKSATVTLENNLPANTDVKVKVKDSISVRDYSVTYNFHPKAVAVQAATYDDDTKGQKLTITADGVATSIDYLRSAGYTIEFNTFDTDGDSANISLFGSASASADGRFQDAVLPSGDYTAQVTISNGSTILTSEKASISVKNLDKVATAINSYELTNNAGFVQNSSTLVFRETATLSKVNISVGPSLAELAPGSFEIKSSDETVVVANSATGVLTAQGLGTAKVTITVGQVTKEITVTVKGEARKAKKATPVINPTKALIGTTSPSTNKVKITDQYGDPVVSATTGVFVHYPINIDGYATTYTTVGGEELNTSGTINGEVAIPLAGATTAEQTGLVLLKNTDRDIIGGFTVTTTEVRNIASLKLEYSEVSESKDDYINAELASDDTISYKISQYTSENVFNGDLGIGDLTGYKVIFYGKVISVNGDTTGNYDLKANDATIDVAIEGAGTTDLAVFKPNGMLVDKKTITVAKDTAKIISVDWKSTPIINYTSNLNYKTVLDITEGAGSTDDIVKGITLTAPVLNKIRIAESANTSARGFTDGDLYIDKNANGVSDNGDRLIGKLAYTISPSATGAFTSIGTDGNGFTGLNVGLGSPAKGIVTFFITDETSSDTTKPVMATKAVIIDVK